MNDIPRAVVRSTSPASGAGFIPFATILALVFELFLGTASAMAFTAADADTSFSAYNRAFYFTEGTNGYYRATTEGGKTWFWERAEQLEMILDAYERTTNAACLTLFSNIFNGFITDHGRDWSGNEFNDDIMWMVIACARAHQHIGNPVFRDVAKSNFDMCYARGWSSNLGGGLYWKTSNLSKNACVNGPGAIAAHLLFQISGNTNYLAKSEALFGWLRSNLFDPTTGAVYDSMNLKGERDARTFTYNQGTFAGAADLLGHTNDARLASDYTMITISRDGLMPRYGESGDGGGFNGICARWLMRFARHRGFEERYVPWLRLNAETAWRNRREDNLSWSRWQHPTPKGKLYSWSCSSAVVLLQVLPPSEDGTVARTETAASALEDFGPPSKVHSSTNASTNGVIESTPTGVWTGIATNSTGGVLATIHVNTKDASDLADWGRRAGEYCVQWYPRIASLLASDGFQPPTEVRINFRNNYAGVAAASGSRIDVSANYVRSATNDFGMIIHELVHVVQSYHRPGSPGWLVEGVADYVRLAHFEPHAPAPHIDSAKASYRDGYKVTARFLQWLEKNRDPQIVRELNRAMREGTFRLEIFEERAGSKLDSLWSQFVASLDTVGR